MCHSSLSKCINREGGVKVPQAWAPRPWPGCLTRALPLRAYMPAPQRPSLPVPSKQPTSHHPIPSVPPRSTQQSLNTSHGLLSIRLSQDPPPSLSPWRRTGPFLPVCGCHTVPPPVPGTEKMLRVPALRHRRAGRELQPPLRPCLRPPRSWPGPLCLHRARLTQQEGWDEEATKVTASGWWEWHETGKLSRLRQVEPRPQGWDPDSLSQRRFSRKA